MLKALIKKELLQINQFILVNKKTKKIRDKKGIIISIILFSLLFILLGASIGGLFSSLALAFLPMGYDWLYFSMTGLIAIVFGIFGDVFNTYALLYKAKDNDLLLAMPISPAYLLASRILGVFLMGALYSGLAFIPAMIVYWIFKSGVTFATVVCPIFTWLVICVFVTVLTCLLGWVVAIVSAKLSNKNITKTLATLGFLAVYYVVYFKAVNSLKDISIYAGSIANTISGWMFLSYHMGLGATGEVGSLFIFTGIVLVLFATTYFVMSRSYIRMTTTIKGSKKVEYHKATVKAHSLLKALVGKELKHFSSSSSYMMNCGIGLVMTLALSVFILFKTNVIRSYLPMINQYSTTIPWIVNAIPAIAAIAPMFLICMNLISAPSLSLEGKNIWVLQSCPVDGKKVFQAKILMHIILCFVPTMLLPLVISYVLQLSLSNTLLVLVFDLLFMLLIGIGGLWVDSKKYNFNWTNEVYPIKQGFSVTVTILGGWGMTVLFAGLFYLLKSISTPLFLGLLIVIVSSLTYLAYRNLMKVGSKEFVFMS